MTARMARDRHRLHRDRHRPAVPGGTGGDARRFRRRRRDVRRAGDARSIRMDPADVVCEVKGGPNGLAVGPDGALYLCNNGGSHTPADVDGLLRPGTLRPRPLLRRTDPAHRPRRHGDQPLHELRRPSAARAERPRDGRSRRLLLHRLRHPRRRAPEPPISVPCTTPAATAPRSTRWRIPCQSPNGVGLSPDGTILYYAETYTGRVFRRPIAEPGVLEPPNSKYDPWALLCGLPGMQLLDSLAVDADGWVAVGTLITGAITSISPDGSSVEQVRHRRPATPRTSASAARTCAPPTSRSRGPAGSCRWSGPAEACASPTSSRSGRPAIRSSIWAARGPDSRRSAAQIGSARRRPHPSVAW